MIYTNKWLDAESLILINSDYMTKKSDRVFHTHEFVEIEYVYSGEGFQEFSGKKHPIKKGDIFFINPGEGHSVYTDNKILIYNLTFSPQIFNDCIDSTQSWLNLIFPNETITTPFLISTQKEISIQIERIIFTITEQFQRKYKDYNIVIKSLLLSMFAIISQNSSTNFKTIANAFLETLYNIDEDVKHSRLLSSSTYASYLNYSPAYFSTYFKKNTGISFTDYVNQKRIEKTIFLLIHTSKSIDDICLESGFKDRKYFYNVFKQHTNTTPAKYRKLHNLVQDN